MQLSEKEKEVLSLLYQLPRESISKTAKRTTLNRQQILYYLNKLEEKKFLISSFPLVNYAKLSYPNFFYFFIKTQSQKEGEELLSSNYLNFCINKGRVRSFFSLYGSFASSNKFPSEIESLKNKQEFILLKNIKTELYPLKFMNNSLRIKSYTLSNEKQEEKYTLDSKEKKILKLLCQDARKKNTDIAKELKFSPELVHYKVKQLEKRNVLLGTRLQLNMKALEYSYHLVLLKWDSFNRETEKKFFEFTEKENHINSAGILEGEYTCFFQIFYKEAKDLKNTLKKFYEKYNSEEIEIISFPIEEELEKINPLPFL